MRRLQWGHPLRRSVNRKKVFFPIFSCFFLGFHLLRWLPMLDSRTLFEPVFSPRDSGHPGGPLLRRGDPFSHPSGSSARWQVTAIHPPRTERAGPPAAPLRLFCRHLETRLPRSFCPAPVPLIGLFRACSAVTCRHLAGSSAAPRPTPIPRLRDQKTFSAGPCSFSIL